MDKSTESLFNPLVSLLYGDYHGFSPLLIIPEAKKAFREIGSFIKNL